MNLSQSVSNNWLNSSLKGVSLLLLGFLRQSIPTEAPTKRAEQITTASQAQLNTMGVLNNNNGRKSSQAGSTTKSTASSGKRLRLRDALLNMLGEFVALNKSPEVRLNSASQQFLAEAVREEKRRLSNEFIKEPRHVRSVSSNAALLRSSPPSSEPSLPQPFVAHSRRGSLPVGPMPPPPPSTGRFHLFPRLRRVAQADERIRADFP